MIVYWSMFLVAASYALVVGTRKESLAYGMQSTRLNISWGIVCLVITLLIGYRFEVGGDWRNYLRHLHTAQYMDIHSAIQYGDPAYTLLNLTATTMGWGIAAVNLICAFLFTTGLVLFCRGLPRPWLALAVAMPYMVTVVAMGYTRQSVALGLGMLGLVALTRKANLWFVVWVLVAATFHKSAVLLLPIAAVAATRNRYWTAAWVGVVVFFAYIVFLADSVNDLYVNYIEAQYRSQGAIIRTAMNLTPACIYLIFEKKFQMPPGEAKLWRWFSIISIALFLMALTTPATTAVDRVALYMLPLQLVIFSYLPDALGRRGMRNFELTSLVLFYYTAVLFVWLNFASHAFAWLPYRFYPMTGLF